MGCGSSIEDPDEGDRPVRAQSIRRMDMLKAERKRLKKERKSISEDIADDLSVASGASSPSRKKSRNTGVTEFMERLTSLIEDNPEDDGDRIMMGEKLYDMLDVRHKGIVKLQDLQEGFGKLGWEDSPQSIRHLFGQGAPLFMNDADAADFEVSKNQFLDMFKQLKTVDTLRKGADPDFSSNFKRKVVKRVWQPGTRVLRGRTITPCFSLPGRVKALVPNRTASQLICCERDAINFSLVSTSPSEGLIRRLNTPDVILDVAVSPDLKYIAVALRDCTATIFDSVCLHQVKQYHHPYAVTCCAFTPDSGQLLTGCYDTLVRRFDVGKGRLIHTTTPSSSINKGVVIVVACVQQFAVVTRTREPGLDILDVKSLRTLKRLETGHATLAWVLKITSCGKYLLSLCERFINVWDTAPLLQKGIMKFVPEISVEVNAVEKYGPKLPSDQKLSWFSATFLPASLAHYFLASSSDLAMTIFNLEGTPIMVFYSVYPVFCFGTCDESDSVYAGDSAGNILSITLF